MDESHRNYITCKKPDTHDYIWYGIIIFTLTSRASKTNLSRKKSDWRLCESGWGDRLKMSMRDFCGD